MLQSFQRQSCSLSLAHGALGICALIYMSEPTCVSALDTDMDWMKLLLHRGSHPRPSCYFDNEINPVEVMLRGSGYCDMLISCHFVPQYNASVNK